MLFCTHSGVVSADDLSDFTALYREHCEVRTIVESHIKQATDTPTMIQVHWYMYIQFSSLTIVNFQVKSCNDIQSSSYLILTVECDSD